MCTAQPTLTVSTPKGPIVVLSKDNTFLYPAPTVAVAVDYINQYLSSDDMGVPDPAMPQQSRPRLDELDFFDGRGRLLAPDVDEGGTLVDLIVKLDHQVEIRERIRQILIAINETLQQLPDAAALADKLPVMPSDELLFDEFMDAIVNDERLRAAAQNCNPVAFLLWRCH